MPKETEPNFQLSVLLNDLVREFQEPKTHEALVKFGEIKGLQIDYLDEADDKNSGIRFANSDTVFEWRLGDSPVSLVEAEFVVKFIQDIRDLE